MKVIPCYGKNHMSKPIPFFKWLHLWPGRRWKRPMQVVALVIWANTGDGAASQPTSLQKDLPSEEKIPSH